MHKVPIVWADCCNEETDSAMAYIDKYGVDFSDDRKTLVKCPVK